MTNDDKRTCPSCERGELDERNVCRKCGVGVPAYFAYNAAWTARVNGRKGCRPDQDRCSPSTDYARYKEDHS